MGSGATRAGSARWSAKNTSANSQASLRAKLALALGALGVVFGDIGTSPLYTIKDCRDQMTAGVEMVPGVLGILSLMFWALVLVVCVKYLLFVTKADNEGEGGIFALFALLHKGTAAPPKAGMTFAVILILIGAALLYGNVIITPAISVLDAAEGLTAINSRFEPAVPAIASVILGILFWFQHPGTRRIGNVFGPVMIIRFGTLALLGIGTSPNTRACCARSIRSTDWNCRSVDPWRLRRYRARRCPRSPAQKRCMRTWVISAGATFRKRDMAPPFPDSC